jgi:hypothetical protein
MESVVLSKFEAAFDSKSRRVGKVTHKDRKITRAEVRKLAELSAAVKPDVDREKIIEKTGTADPVKLVHMARRMKEREITHERDTKRHTAGRFVDPSGDMTAAEADEKEAEMESMISAEDKWSLFYEEVAHAWPAEKQYGEMLRRGVINMKEYGDLMDQIKFGRRRLDDVGLNWGRWD